MGISRKTATSVAAHVEDLPELAHEVACIILPGAGKGARRAPQPPPSLPHDLELATRYDHRVRHMLSEPHLDVR